MLAFSPGRKTIMPEINVRQFRRVLEGTFRKYLFTLNFMPDNEKELREAFGQALLRQQVFSRDPLLNVIPSYPPDKTPSELMVRQNAPRLHPGLKRLAEGGLDPDRPLYEHQARSIEKVQRGRNLVVASGTGSGKTECFLLPLLDDAIRNPGPGVRAIIIYPLNALANDQLDRLRRLLRAVPEITFGRYTGDTPWTRDDAPEEERSAAPPNECFSRNEIRDNPPHILLTNFAMLEYLLLRPKDSDVFNQQRLQFLVLDEAHTYSGAQGIDVSLLMRRVREAFPSRELQYILTSATMGNDKDAIAQFCRTLTGGNYTSDDVLFGSPITGFDSRLNAPIPLSKYAAAVPDSHKLDEWLNSIGDKERLLNMLQSSGLDLSSALTGCRSSGDLLTQFLRANDELAHIHACASESPLTIEQISRELWGHTSSDALNVTEWLIALGANAVADAKTSSPLLPARYHFFFRGLQGASVCISPECTDKHSDPSTIWSRLVLDNQPDCACGAGLFPLLTCFHCGTPYLRVAVVDGKWRAIAPGMGAEVHILTWSRDTEEEDDESEEEESELTRPASVCLSCRSIEIGGQLTLACCEHPVVRELRVLITKKADGNLTRCPICAGRAQPYPTVLRGFATGEDAATAVLAEAAIRSLPREIRDKPAEGRRILCFSDSRQRAAYFAPYLGRTTAETQYMQPLFDAIRIADKRNAGKGATFTEVADSFWDRVQDQKYVVIRTPIGDGEYKSELKASRKLLPADERELQRECLVALFQHFTASPRNRQNLPGLALAHLNVAWNRDDRETLPKRLPWAFQNGWESGDAFLQWILRIFAWRRALTFPEGIRLQMIGAGPKCATFHACDRGLKEGRQIHRWNPYRAKALHDLVVSRSPQAEIAAKLFGLDKHKEAELLSVRLDELWNVLVDLEILDRAFPNEYQLPWQRFSIRTAGDWFSCSRCGLLTVHAVNRACVMPGCGGTLRTIGPDELARRYEDHHWFARYTSMPAFPLKVEEHTAQLTSKKGAEYQRQFSAGDVNVLSCSTTFEMGVDVGTLKAVFLRNVPPTPANYIQRAGRAGRRREGAAFAITYARSSPHDQTHFFKPGEIVNGTVPVPRISLANKKLTQRHVNSFLLGAFLKTPEANIANDQILAGRFFLEPAPAQSPASHFGSWVNSNENKLAGAVQRLIDPGAKLDPLAALRQSRTEMEKAQKILLERLEGFEKQRSEAKAQYATAESGARYKAVRNMESAERLIKDLRHKERLIDFLASEPHLLPSYAFPQDVVKLLVRQENLSQDLRLERDLEYGIAEYAPGSEIIADGKLLTSGGIDLQNRELHIRSYRICSTCNRVDRAEQKSDLPRQCPTCGASPTGQRSRPMSYIVPRGFTTLIDDQVDDVRLYRLKPPPNSEVFLVEGAPQEQFMPHRALPGIKLGHCPNGTLFRANSGAMGKHFHVCRVCGNAKKGDGSHQKPWGAACKGSRVVVDLVCEFQTDTLQIRFDGVSPAVPSVSERGFWLSLQTAFINSTADVLVIPTRDLDGTYRSQGEGSNAGELVIYDRVPGGAGYVGRIRQELPNILAAALQRVEKCPNPTCEMGGSCYSCLRTYGNQFNWDLLRRNLVANWLRPVLVNRAAIELAG
jgi:superfamily II DNA/RNA helicase